MFVGVIKLPICQDKENKMPIYEYYCPQCKSQFELRLSFSESSRTSQCPKCKTDAERLISSFACKTGGNLQATEKPFRQGLYSETNKSGKTGASSAQGSIVPASERARLLSPSGKRSVRSRGKKDQKK